MSQLNNEEPLSQSQEALAAPEEALPGRLSRLAMRRTKMRNLALLTLVTYLIGLGSGFILWGKSGGTANSTEADAQDQAHAKM